MSDGTDLWRFECRYGHGEFDVWGTDWSDVERCDWPPHVSADSPFEPDDVRTTRCPTCRIGALPVGPPECLV